jgi:sugar O-acyltransferase (sialic acid O-acetyltransferase NeuD family)
MYDLVIVSAGKFGRELLFWASDCVDAGQPFRIKGFLDKSPDALAGLNYDVPILGSVESYQPSPADRFAIAVGDPLWKKRHAAVLRSRSAQFANIIHPKAVLGRNVRMGTGVILGPYSLVSSDVTLGDFVTIGPFCATAHDTVLGDYCQLSSHCSINGNASLGVGVFMGAGVTIIPKARVGDWAYVGAGSVVLRRVEPHDKVFGNPAAIIGQVEIDPEE